jgi:LPXTG-site transpeptidase (sortase) family protein
MRYDKVDNMDKPSISTVIVIACLLIIGLYAMGEVNYFSSKIIVEKDLSSPKIIIPSIGVDERINTESLNLGVMSDPGENVPGENPVVLYGHRTLQGSPFLRLNELEKGDTFLLEWPGVGELNYSVANTTTVPASYDLNEHGKNTVYLITCDPIGSTENRIIVQGELTDKNPINNRILQNNPQESNALVISVIFLAIGSAFSYFYPKENKIYILATVLAISAVLFYCCINPIPSELIYDKIIFLNGGF